MISVSLLVIGRSLYGCIWPNGNIPCDIGLIVSRIWSATCIDPNLRAALVSYNDSNIYMIIPRASSCNMLHINSLYHVCFLCIVDVLSTSHIHYIYSLMQKRRNSSALAMELRLFCIKPSICRFACSRKPNTNLIFRMTAVMFAPAIDTT